MRELKCVAMCCSVMKCKLVYCSSRVVDVCCSVCCSVLQRVAVCFVYICIYICIYIYTSCSIQVARVNVCCVHITIFAELARDVANAPILLHTATPYSTLQLAATHCNTHCNTLQHSQRCQRSRQPCTGCCGSAYDVIHCNTMQYTASHCNTLQPKCNTLQNTATHCNTLPHTATHCIALHHTTIHRNTPRHTKHTATHYITLHHTATHCNTPEECQKNRRACPECCGSAGCAALLKIKIKSTLQQ